MRGFLFVCPFILAGCVTFFPHNAFKESMDTLVYNSRNSKITIDGDYFQNINSMLSKEYSVKETDVGEKFIIHYALSMPWNAICYYHVIVDKKTRLLIEWGFDEDKGDPKVCGIAG